MKQLKLGPTARRLIRFVARFVNPAVLLFAGRRWMPIVGVLEHRGRRSGRVYRTPLGMRPHAGAFVIPLTFEERAAWYQNVTAAGGAVVRYGGRRHRVVAPEVVDYDAAAPAFPRYERLQFRLLGIGRYLRLHDAPAEQSQSVGKGDETMSKPSRSGLALLTIAIAQLMVVLDTTIVNVALPSVQRALGLSTTDLEWVVNAYALAFGGLLLLGGRAGDLFGRRRMFVSGVLLFSAGSLAAGLAQSAAWLIASRVAQGAGAAIVAPTALSLIADTFAEGRARNRALGVYAGAAGSGGAIGLVLGGLIVNYLSWRWVLFVNVPIGLVLALVAPRVLASPSTRRGQLDIPGAAAATAAMTLAVYGLSRAATYGWSDLTTIAALTSAVTLLALFVLVELRSTHPLVPMGLFASRNRSGAYVLRLLAGATTLSVLFFLSQFMQNLLGYSPLDAGLAFLPLGVGVVITAQIASRVVGRIGPRLPIAAGTLIVAAGLAWLAQLTMHAVYTTDILPALVALSAGLGLIFFPTTVTAVAGTSRHESGLASAMLNVSQQLGGSIGLAVFGTIAAAKASPAEGFTAAFAAGAYLALAGFFVALLMIRGTRANRAVERLPEAA